jgi:hypothetical protein
MPNLDGFCYRGLGPCGVMLRFRFGGVPVRTRGAMNLFGITLDVRAEGQDVVGVVRTLCR